MNPQRAKLLAELLREMREQDGEWFPDEVWLEIHKTVAMPYVELLIPRWTEEKWEVLLTRRASTETDWPSMWHMPGGLWRAKLILREACQAVALRELGVELADVQELMTFKWRTHPRGEAISHVCLCWSKAEIKETPDCKFFSELPLPFIEEEIEFVDECLNRLIKTKRK